MSLTVRNLVVLVGVSNTENVVQKERILYGLNKHFDEVRGRIFGVKLLQSVREAFSEVRQEEIQSSTNSAEASVLPACGPNINRDNFQQRKKADHGVIIARNLDTQ